MLFMHVSCQFINHLTLTVGHVGSVNNFLVLKMKTDILNLIPSALTIIYATYGSWFLVKEIFCSVVPFTILLTLIIVGLIYVLRIPAPNVNAVENVLGREPHLENPEGIYVMKTVAHRGAGLDAPENSLVAFQMVRHDLNQVTKFFMCL